MEGHDADPDEFNIPFGTFLRAAVAVLGAYFTKFTVDSFWLAVGAAEALSRGVLGC